MTNLSAVIITLNEEKNIERCLRSLKPVVEEIVVMDSGSTDNTVQLSQSLGAKVISCAWKGYAETKNEGNRAASNNYILWLDADEVISEELAKNINAAKTNLSGAYTFNRLNNYCGKWIRHGGFYPDRKVRIFNRAEAQWKGDHVHEKLELQTGIKLSHLEGDLLHYSYVSPAEHWQRMKKYSSLGAKQVAGKSFLFKFFKMLISPAFRFIRSFFFRAGFLDGFKGFLLSSITSIEVFEKYRKAMF